MENLRVSTCTACGEISGNISLENFLNNINPNNFIRYCETSSGNKGYAKKNDKKKRKITNKRKLFMNQGTLIVWDEEEEKLVNIKLFSNKSAKIQMTGILSKEMGIRILNKIIKYILNLDIDFVEEKKIFNNNDIKILDFKIVMINCDYDFGFLINREKLYEDLVDADYYATYSPDGYPGVNAKYMHNTNNTCGICECENLCDGKGNGCGDGECRRVTLAIFQSGKMLCTGGQNFKQVEDSFNFINKFITENKNKYILR